MKVAVTGAAGHVGNNLCRELIKLGHSVKALYHRNTSAIDQLDMAKVKGDILDNGHRNISHEKAHQELGFHPRPLWDTLKDSFVWFKQVGMIKS